MSLLLAVAIVGSADAQAPASPAPPMTGKAEGAVVRVRGTVSAVDKENKTITLKGPRGRTITLDVHDPTKLEPSRSAIRSSGLSWRRWPSGSDPQAAPPRARR